MSEKNTKLEAPENKSGLERRQFLKKAGVGATALGAIALTAACTKKTEESAAPAVQAKKKFEWKMVTTWPKGFPGLGTGADYLARIIGEMSDGQLTVKVYGGGELVPALESFDAVSKGTAEMGHGAAYYWKGKSEAAQFFAAVPFGLNADEMTGWIYYGGGQQLWDEVYAPFGVKGFAAGNTGVQMGGWFNKEINSINDFNGLKMRMPGLGGEVLGAIGAVPVNLPGGEIFSSLQSGAIDATEWVGPYNDLAFGFYKAAKYYYWPGWHEPGTTLECFVNLNAFNELPKELQAVVEQACKAANGDMFAEFTARNSSALNDLIVTHGVQLKRFPDDVLMKLATASQEVVSNLAGKNAENKKVYDSFAKFRADSIKWNNISEVGYSLARASIKN